MSKPVILFGPLPPPYGGVSVFVSSLWTHLKDSELRLWALFGSETSDAKITRFNHRRLGVVTPLIRQSRNARIVDFTHFHFEYPHPILLPIWLTAKLAFDFEWYKYILDGSLPERHARFNGLKKMLFQRAVNAVDEFIVVSEELRQWLTEEIKVKQKITVIPCLLNIPDKLRQAPLSVPTQNALEPFLRHESRVSSIGVFIPSYGFKHVAQAVEKLREQTNEDVGLLLLDGGFALEESYREEVLMGRDWITVITNVPNPEVYEVLRSCEVFVRAFGSESYGISRVEALWCGVPVVATDVGETRGMLTYRFGDEVTLEKLIREVLSGADTPDIKAWAEQFRLEAENNLRRFAETVGLKTN
jgi:glycosyltransferase involved in cell wall biosynthesis